MADKLATVHDGFVSRRNLQIIEEELPRLSAAQLEALRARAEHRIALLEAGQP